MATISPTSRTLQALKADPDCLRAERVEQWVQTGDVRRDLPRALADVFKESQGAHEPWVEDRFVAAVLARLPTGGFRRDMFGFVDIVALMTKGIVGIQATTGPNAAARIAKIHDKSTGAFEWLSCHGLVEVWAWRKVSVGKRWLWRPRVVPLTLADLRAGRGAERLHDPPPESLLVAGSGRAPP